MGSGTLVPVSTDSVAKGRGVNWLAEGKTRADKIFICLVPLTLLMAKRSSSKKASKHYPVQRRIELGRALPTTPDVNFVVRVDKLLSNVNHRLYRQSRLYNSKIDIDPNLPDGSVVQVFALADTWFNHKSYQLAKKMFDENSAEELAQLGNSKARWNDFRVDHGDSTSVDLLALQSDVVLPEGDYHFSEVADAAGGVNTFRWKGTGTGTFNIVAEYDATGNTDVTPSTPLGQVAYDGLTDELDDNQMSHLSDDGNGPPYDRTGFPANPFVHVATLAINATGDDKISTGFFKAPYGLILVSTSGGLDANSVTGKIYLTVKNGDYKGVSGINMLE